MTPPAVPYGTEPVALPVVVRLTEQHIWDAAMEEWMQRVEARCEAFQATGRHRWETEPSPAFFCDRSHPSRSWVGYLERCVSPAPYVDRSGQYNGPCGLLRHPDDDCIVCARFGEYLCDAPRCDVPLCDAHRVAGYRGMDFCPDHQDQRP